MPVTLWEAQDDSILALGKKIGDKVLIAKQNKDKDHNEVTKLFTVLPTYLLGFILTVGSYLG